VPLSYKAAPAVMKTKIGTSLSLSLVFLTQPDNLSLVRALKVPVLYLFGHGLRIASNLLCMHDVHSVPIYGALVSVPAPTIQNACYLAGAGRCVFHSLDCSLSQQKKNKETQLLEDTTHQPSTVFSLTHKAKGRLQFALYFDSSVSSCFKCFGSKQTMFSRHKI